MSPRDWRPNREPFGPLVVRTRRGVMHRAAVGPRLHPRCAGGKPFLGEVLTTEQAVEWATGREWALCRYPWCFREVVRAAGIDPEVGHTIRAVGRPRKGDGRTRKAPAHRPEPVRAHDRIEGWAVCSCGDIVIRCTDLHNPSRSWWTHKGVAAS